jgi:predicted transposase YbfD/YdcC
MRIFKSFENQTDTYHDTRTHYLMENDPFMLQDPFLLQDQADVMDVVAADKVEVLKKKRMGPPGPCSS